MKTKIATALSMVGVLGAGSAAALVNTQILDSGPSSAGASAAVLPPATAVDVSIPATLPVESSTTSPTSTAPSSTTPDTTAPSTPTVTTPAATGYLTAFNVGDAGVVTVDVIDGQIVLVSAEPKAGWKRTKAETGDDEVEVVFVSATVRVEFEASFVNGQIVPKVESKAIGSSTSTVPSTTSPTPGTSAPVTTIDDSDHEDDDHESDDHDEDQADHDGGGDDDHDDD